MNLSVKFQIWEWIAIAAYFWKKYIYRFTYNLQMFLMYHSGCMFFSWILLYICSFKSTVFFLCAGLNLYLFFVVCLLFYLFHLFILSSFINLYFGCWCFKFQNAQCYCFSKQLSSHKKRLYLAFFFFNIYIPMLCSSLSNVWAMCGYRVPNFKDNILSYSLSWVKGFTKNRNKKQPLYWQRQRD